MRKGQIILCLAGAGLISACNYGKQATQNAQNAMADMAAASDAIRAEESQALLDWKARDAARITGHYTEDATLMLPQMTMMSGTGEIRKAIDEVVKDTNFSLDFASQKIEIASSGDIAYSQGTYSQTYSDPKTKAKVSENGYYLTVFKMQEDGSWKAIEDIATPGPAPANALATETDDGTPPPS